MSRLYGERHRALQDEFDNRRMADRIEAIAVKTELGEAERAFIGSRDMFFLTTVDDRGRPTVSYKGGDPGFIRVTDPKTLLFPSYDGNGMYLSMGNIAGNPEIGMLCIDFERPFRLRLQGRAELTRDLAALALYKEAELVIRVVVSEVWMNCPRYVHRMQKVKPSRYVPREGTETPLCEWKRIEGIEDALRPTELAAVEKAGKITEEQWIGRIIAGDDNV
jgi:predicted pyridoxine 5'-phosphate oxidase superfamily flavin-nucleotide-binding protein